MALIKLDIDVAIPYVPLFDRKNTKDPLTLHIKYVPGKLANEYADQMARAVEGVTNREKRARISREYNRDQFISQVVKIENYTDKDGNEINDAGDFYDSVDSSLIYEILDAMVTQSSLTEGQRKNSVGD